MIMNKTILISGFLLLAVSCSKEKDYDATGIFEATTVTVSAETSGKILNFNKVEGDSINMGEILAEVDSTILVLQREQLHSQRLSAESNSPDISAQLASLRTQISHQENECARIGRLYADGAATQKQQDDAQALLATLKAQKDALLSTLTKSQSSISDNSAAILYQKEQIGEQIAKCRVTAPLTGTILTKYSEAGEFAAPGKPLCKIADLNKIYLRAYFTASQLASIKLGQKVTVIADFGGDEQYEYPGTITWIAEESEFTPKSIQTKDSRANLVYAVKVAVNNDGRLKLGQYGEVRL